MGISYLAPNPTIVDGLLVDVWKSKFHIADPTIVLIGMLFKLII